MILIIDNYDSFTYNLYQCVAQIEPNVQVIRNDKITLDEIRKLKPGGIILSPGPGRPEDAGICVELVRDLNINVPILGVCLGLQAIATAFGCRVIRAPEIVHGKPELIFHSQQGIYRNLPSPFQAGRYHSLVAEQATLPKTLTVDAKTANGLIMGVRHVSRSIYGVQFHPESILTPLGHHLLHDFVKECLENHS